MTAFVTAFLALLLAYLLAYTWKSNDPRLSRARLEFASAKRAGIHLAAIAVCFALFDSSALTPSIGLIAWLAAYLIVTWAIELLRRPFDRPNPSAANGWKMVLPQALHLLAILAFAFIVSGAAFADLAALLAAAAAYKSRILIALIVYIVTIFAGGNLIRVITRPLADHVRNTDGAMDDLPNAGLFIGWLERLLVVTAVLLQSPSIIGLIFAGKSIARFREMKDERFAEYFLIGTLLSVAIALLGGIVIQLCWYGTVQLK